MHKLPDFESAAALVKKIEGGEYPPYDSWLDYAVTHGIYHFNTREFIESLIELITALQPSSVLEICAGDGALSAHLSSLPIRAVDDGSMGGGEKTKHVFPVEELTAIDALSRYRPDVVIASFPPTDIGIDKAVLGASSVSSYIYIGAELSGMFGADALWDTPGFERTYWSELTPFQITRFDVYSPVTGELIQHGRTLCVRRMKKR
jgi:hypothetical protein